MCSSNLVCSSDALVEIEVSFSFQKAQISTYHSDLHGVIAVSFEPNRGDGNVNGGAWSGSHRIRNSLKKIKSLNTSEDGAAPEMPPEFKLPWFERRVLLSPTQQKLLSMIEDGQPVAHEYLLAQFPGRSESELFYRIEQLRLLGFATRTGDENAFVYHLSDSYGKAYSTISRQGFRLYPDVACSGRA